MSTAILKGNASGTGSMTLESPNTNSNRTVTVPDVDGQMMVSGNMPAFSAYNNANQNITANTWTKVTLNTEEFDTNSAFDSTTNFRFTPQVAGYYQVSGQVYPNTTTSFGISAIYKNGVARKAVQTSAGNIGVEVSALIYLNGSTDYVELYGYLTGTTPQIYASSVYTWLQASLVRAA